MYLRIGKGYALFLTIGTCYVIYLATGTNAYVLYLRIVGCCELASEQAQAMFCISE